MKKRNKIDQSFGFDFSAFRSLGLLGIALINFFASATLFLPAPGFLAVGVGGKFYNPLLVAGLAALGATLGEVVGFAFGYSSRKLSKSQKNILHHVGKLLHHKYAPLIIVFFAFIPNPFFDAVGIVAGVSLFPLRNFLIFTFIGRFLRDVLIAYAGYRYL
jgi:membrane protein YqaA with SNARE-associated domain